MNDDINTFVPAGPPSEQCQKPAPRTPVYTDKRGREWPYWPLCAADQMWRKVKCNQLYCGRPATFVGVCDLQGDGTEYFDGAAAWCFWCMPREHMNPEARRAAEHADWARRETLDECIAAIKLAGYANHDAAATVAVLRDMLDEIGRATATRQSVLADPETANLREVFEGRELEAIHRYEERPEGTVAGYRIEAVPPTAG